MHTVSIILQYAKTKINTIFISSKAKTEETKSSKSQLCFARFAFFNKIEYFAFNTNNVQQFIIAKIKAKRPIKASLFYKKIVLRFMFTIKLSAIIRNRYYIIP